MKRVPSAEFVRNFSALCDEALSDPVVLTRNGRDRLVVASMDNYKHLLSLALMNSTDENQTENISSQLNLMTRSMRRVER